MKRLLISAAVATVISSQVYAADVSGTVTFANDYRYRGKSQTAGDTALQGSLDLSLENGIFAGIWGSNVDFGDDANLEIDWYVGYAGSFTEELSYDATLYYYQYPGYQADDIDYAEVAFGLYYGDFSLAYQYADDVIQLSEEGHYLSLNYSKAITEQINIDIHAGRSFGDYWKQFDIGEYSDFSVGISGSVAGVDLSAAYLFNDIDSATKVDSGLFRNDNTVLLTVSRTF
tara:strand:- start:1927 stop:2616 length:690 start_codon:yes stop_codon:yes gene_type:complete